jgi:hypothetical protein
MSNSRPITAASWATSLGLGAKPVETCQQRCLQGFWDIALARGLAVLDEQRDAAGPFTNDCDYLFRQRRAARRPCDFGRLATAQAVERQSRDMRMTGPVGLKFGPVRDQHKDP